MKAVSIEQGQQTNQQHEQQLRALSYQGMSENTLKSLNYDKAVFLSWLGDNKLNWLNLLTDQQALELAICEFYQAKAKDKSLATLRRYNSSLKKWFNVEHPGQTNPFDSALIKAKFKALKGDTESLEQEQAKAFESKHIHQCVAHFESLDKQHSRQVQDIAILLTAYSTLARVSELATIKVSDLNLDEGHVKVRVHKLKETHIRHLDPLAVKYIMQWLAVSNITDGYLFRSVANSGAIGDNLTTRSFIRCLQRCGDNIGLDGISGHSCRVGAAIDMTKANISIGRIMLAGGWTTPTMIQRYTKHLKVKHSGMVGIL